MRLVMVVTSFPRLSETFLVNKFIGLHDKGIDVHVVCSSINREDMQYFPGLTNRSRLRSRIHRAPPHRPRWLAGLLALPVFIRTLLANPVGTVRYFQTGHRITGQSILKRLYLDSGILVIRPDIVHFEFGAQVSGIRTLKHALQCKVVVSFRGYDLNYHGLENPGHYQEVWGEADALHLLGADLWRRAQIRGCPPSKPHVLIPPAIDIKFFSRPASGGRPAVTRGGPIRILSVGRMEWKKGYEFALQAIHFLLDDGIACEYRIVGDGSYLHALAFAVHQLRLDDSVKLLGALSPAEVKGQLAHADIFLHAAVSEGFCNAVLEAQAMNLPVVCTDADGLPENIEDGVTGFVVRRRDSRALAEKLSVLAGDPALRLRMGEAGRNRVAEKFQLEQQVMAFESLYVHLHSGELLNQESTGSLVDCVHHAAPMEKT